VYTYFRTSHAPRATNKFIYVNILTNNMANLDKIIVEETTLSKIKKTFFGRTTRITTVLTTALTLSPFYYLYAQEKLPRNPGESYVNRYVSELFDEADTNNDDYVSWEEAKYASNQFERDIYGEKRFNIADRNNDGLLSREEAKEYVKKEKLHKEDIRKAKRRKARYKDGTKEKSLRVSHNQQIKIEKKKSQKFNKNRRVHH